MKLTVDQTLTLNKIRNYILNNVPKDQQEKIKCNSCRGTGLDNICFFSSYNNSVTYWDGDSYCDKCGGTGFINSDININDTYFTCNKCNGSGIMKNGDCKYEYFNNIQCDKCNGTGFTDWLGNILK